MLSFLRKQTIYPRLTCLFTICISQLQEDFRFRCELDVDLYMQESILVLIIQFGLYNKILNATLNWESKEGDVPENSCAVESDSPRDVSMVLTGQPLNKRLKSASCSEDIKSTLKKPKI